MTSFQVLQAPESLSKYTTHVHSRGVNTTCTQTFITKTNYNYWAFKQSYRSINMSELYWNYANSLTNLWLEVPLGQLSQLINWHWTSFVIQIVTVFLIIRRRWSLQLSIAQEPGQGAIRQAHLQAAPEDDKPTLDERRIGCSAKQRGMPQDPDS